MHTAAFPSLPAPPGLPVPPGVRGLDVVAAALQDLMAGRRGGFRLVAIDTGDEIATGATLFRLIRIGERSLTAVWDMQDISV